MTEENMYTVILDDIELNNFVILGAVRSIPNCAPVAFTHACEALAFIRANAAEIGVMIVDYDMPEMNGVEVIEAARVVEGFRAPIVMITANGEKELRRIALQAG